MKTKIWLISIDLMLLTEVSKIIDCINKDFGCTIYKCLDCNDYVFAHNTCKSRLCTSCDYKCKLEKVENILSTAYNYNHRQIVFTVPKDFRKFIFFPFYRIDILFDVVNLTLNSIINTSYKKTKKKIKKYILVNKNTILVSLLFFILLVEI